MQGLRELWKVIVTKGSVEEEKRLTKRIKPLPASAKAHGREETVLVLIFSALLRQQERLSLTFPDPGKLQCRANSAQTLGKQRCPGPWAADSSGVSAPSHLPPCTADESALGRHELPPMPGQRQRK